MNEEIYVVKRNTDLSEGKGHMETIAIVESYEDARRLAMGTDPYGIGVLSDIVPLSVYKGEIEKHPKFNMSWFKANIRREGDILENKRKKALDKLTDEEKRLLGLND